MSSRGLSSTELRRMLVVRRPTPEPHMKPYDPTRTVAPRDVFGDFDHVMAGLGRGRTGQYQVDAGVDSYADDDIQDISLFEASSDTLLDDAESYSSDTVAEEETDRDYEYKAPKKYRPAHLSLQRVSKSTCSVPSRSSRGSKGRRMHPYAVNGRNLVSLPVIDTAPSLQCPYVSPVTHEQCAATSRNGKTVDWLKKRHWKTCHLYAEAKDMDNGLLRKFEGALIRSQAELDETLRKIPRCPLCLELITRTDSMKRHKETVHKLDPDGQLI